MTYINMISNNLKISHNNTNGELVFRLAQDPVQLGQRGNMSNGHGEC